MPAQHDSRSDHWLGWDIGGAHLKAALVRTGRIEAAAQVPCDLWRGLGALDMSLAALPDWARGPACHAVTMTGELCDVFPDRHAGVVAIAGWVSARLSPAAHLYGGRAGFLALAEADRHARDVASANWHATARLVGHLTDAALLVDIGSTTSDMIPVVAGVPTTVGYTDAERLATGELVYAGMVRTPLAALADKVPFAGQSVSVAAEPFATTADVHRLLGQLAEEDDQQPPADGGGKTADDCRRRLARMVGRDAADAPPGAWSGLAARFAELQLRRLHDAASLILSRTALPIAAPVVGCGIGTPLACRLAARLERPYRDFAGLLPASPDTAASASACAPAAAVALLAAGKIRRRSPSPGLLSQSDFSQPG